MKPPQSRPSFVLLALGLLACLLTASVAGAAGTAQAGLSFAPGPPIPAGPAPNYAAVADLNGDGRLDLAVADSGYWNDLRVLLGTGAGAFRPAGRPLAIGGHPDGMTAADFNGDGKPDLAVASANPNIVKVLLGDGSGSMTAALGAPVAVGGSTTGMLVAADLNRDGKVDLVVPFFSQGAFRVASLLGDGVVASVSPRGRPLGSAGATTSRWQSPISPATRHRISPSRTPP